MSDRKIPVRELQADAALNRTLEKNLPGILKSLPQDVSRQVADHVYQVIGNPTGKVMKEVILGHKYRWLVSRGHIQEFTAEEIAEANKNESDDGPQWPGQGTGPDDGWMTV